MVMLGTVVCIMQRICLKRSAPDTEDASTVVSDIGDTLSPKYAPDIMAPAVNGSGMPSALPMPSKAMPIVAIVVHDVPVITDTSEEMMQAHGRNNDGVIICTP